MSYRNNQFYQLGETSGATFQESTLGRKKYNYYHPDADNPRFIYPDRTVRTYETKPQYVVTPYGATLVGTQIVAKREVLKRGFMRSIARTSGEDVKKVQFQFNPQTITQNVRMTDGLLNFFQQDPGQYAQPMAGNTDMSFTLMFDRTMEINNPVGATSYYSPTGGGYQTTPGSQTPSTRSPWETGDPQYVGVLRDIAALYGVIGQGVSEADVQGRIQEIQAAIKAETLGQEPDVEDVNKSLEQVQQVLNVNIGNYALLVPRPVRVVLSSLYMVEGFVTSTSVTFTKFNTAFVPIQAVVNITMRAMHVGFAKKDTFLTYSLEQAEQIAIKQEQEQREVARETYVDAQNDLTNWYLEVELEGLINNTAVMEAWDAGGPYAQTLFHLVATAQGSNLNSIKDLMDDGGANVKVWHSFKAYTGMPGLNDPIGREKVSPSIHNEWTWVMATKDQVSKRGEAGGGGTFITPNKGIRRFTPVPAYGGPTRFVWEVRVEITHNGQQLRGYGRAADDFVGTQSSWENNELTKELSLRWDYFGDAVSGTPVVGSGIPELSNMLRQGSPSGVN